MSFANKQQLLDAFAANFEKLSMEDENKLILIRDQNYVEFVGQLAKDMGSPAADLMHMAIGVSGEAGELIDAIKKNWVYGKPLDRTNIIEELGDLEFYMAGIRLLLGIPRHDVLLANRAKLAQRYGDSYSDAAAIARADKVEPVLQVIDVTSPTYLQEPKAESLPKEAVDAMDEMGSIATASVAGDVQLLSEPQSSELAPPPQE